MTVGLTVQVFLFRAAHEPQSEILLSIAEYPVIAVVFMNGKAKGESMGRISQSPALSCAYHRDESIRVPVVG